MQVGRVSIRKTTPLGPGFVPGPVAAITDVVQRTFKHKTAKVPATLVAEESEHHPPATRVAHDDPDPL